MVLVRIQAYLRYRKQHLELGLQSFDELLVPTAGPEYPNRSADARNGRNSGERPVIRSEAQIQDQSRIDQTFRGWTLALGVLGFRV